MADIIGDIAAPVGKYIKDGDEKTRWMKIGVLMKTDRGFRIKLDAIPVGGGQDGLWLSVFEPDEGQRSGSRQNASKNDSTANQKHAVNQQDDIPF
jgi:single-strand DNA-binding protein